MTNFPMLIRFFFLGCIALAMVQTYHLGANLTLLGEKSYRNLVRMISLENRNRLLCPVIVEIVLIMALLVGQISFFLLIKKSYQLVQRVFSAMEVICSKTSKEYSTHQVKEMFRNLFNKIVVSNLMLTGSLFGYACAMVTIGLFKRELVFYIPESKTGVILCYPLRVPFLLWALLYPICHIMIFTNNLLSEFTSTTNILELKCHSESNTNLHAQVQTLELQSLQKMSRKYVLCYVVVAMVLQLWIYFTIICWKPTMYSTIDILIMNLQPRILILISSLIVYFYIASGKELNQIPYHDAVLII